MPVGKPPSTERQEAAERSRKGCRLLKQGRFSEGWPAYESRFLASGRPRKLPQPLWRGEDLSDRSLFVHREQGVGDELLYASCLSELQTSCGELTVSCDERLEGLYARSFPGVHLLSGKPGHEDWQQGADLRVDFQTPAGHVPRYLRSQGGDFPTQHGFLEADDSSVQRWRSRLDALGEGLKVGISWQGGLDLLSLRMVPWELWREIFSIDGLQFVNLQPGDSSSVLHNIESRWAVRVHTFPEADPMKSLDEVGALMTALDLVLTVPNANVHLAGALGLPVWVLFTPAFGCWWIVNDEETPWYPSARIFIRAPDALWRSVLEPLRESFAELGD